MAAQPAPKSWIANRRLLSSELNQAVRNWNLASALGLATTKGQMPYAVGTRELTMLDPPTTSSVLKHSGDPTHTPYWGAPVTIADASIEHRHLADDAVHDDNIQDRAVTHHKLGLLAVGETNLGDDAVTTPKIDDDAVTAPKIANDAIRREHLSEYTAHVSAGQTASHGLAGSLLIRQGTIPVDPQDGSATFGIFKGSYTYPTYGWFFVMYYSTDALGIEKVFSTWTVPCALGYDKRLEFDETGSAHGYIHLAREYVRRGGGSSTLPNDDAITVTTYKQMRPLSYRVYWYEGIPGVGIPG